MVRKANTDRHNTKPESCFGGGLDLIAAVVVELSTPISSASPCATCWLCELRLPVQVVERLRVLGLEIDCTPKVVRKELPESVLMISKHSDRSGHVLSSMGSTSVARDLFVAGSSTPSGPALTPCYPEPDFATESPR